jgi:cytochrome c-type biogenesis protein CcmH/NrfG
VVGWHDDAIAAYERALKKRPGDTGAWLGVAWSYMEQSIYQASTQCFEMALKASGGAPEVLADIRRARQRLQALAANRQGVAP